MHFRTAVERAVGFVAMIYRTVAALERRRREGAQRVLTGGGWTGLGFSRLCFRKRSGFRFCRSEGGVGHVILSSISSKIRLDWLVVFSLFAIVAFRDWMVAVT